MRIETIVPALNEYQRRRYLSAEAKTYGYGGISLVSRLSGVSRQTLTEGVKELDNTQTEMAQGRCRKPGGGRKAVWEERPEIMDVLRELLEPHTKGDPMRLLLWTNKSLRSMSTALAEKGYAANKDTVGVMLRMLGYGLQAGKKTLTVKPSHPDRDAQFEHINSESRIAITQGNPVLSIDAKKKENIGNFKNNGRTISRKKRLWECLTTIFRSLSWAKPRRLGYTIFSKTRASSMSA